MSRTAGRRTTTRLTRARPRTYRLGHMRLAVLLLALALPASAHARSYGGPGREAKLEPVATHMADAVRDAWPGARIRIDASLSQAASEIAAAMAGGLSLDEAARPETIRLALARAGGVAPEIGPVLVRASERDAALRRLRERLRGEASQSAPGQVGVGAVERAGTTSLVVLRAPERVALEPFPTQVEVGARHRLAGRVLAPLRKGTFYVTGPGGTPTRLKAGTNGPRFSAQVAFPKPGRYTVEVLADGPRGPEVAALLDVWAGQPIPTAPAAAAPAEREPAKVADKEKLAARLVNDLRRGRGLREVQVDPALARIARGNAEELLRTGRFAHESPISGSLADRLEKGRYAYRAAGENLAQAATVRQAHDSTVHSPGHLANLLGAQWTHAGFGIAHGTLPGGSPTVVLVEVFATPGQGR